MMSRTNVVGDRGSYGEKDRIMPSRRDWLRGGDRRTIVIVSLLAGLAGAAVGQAPAPPAPQPAPAADPLIALNEAFRAAYRRAKEANLAQAGPVILMEGDNIVLRRGGSRVETPYTPAVYHILKSVAHVPLALDVVLAPHADEATLNDKVLAELREYRRLMEQVEPSLVAHGLVPEQLERQKTIFAECRAFLDSVVQARRCSGEERVAFARRMTPIVMKNVGEAARAELDSLHARIRAWRSEMTPEEWKGLKVVILGSALPRKQSLTVQYFARLLGEPGEGARIIYAESVREEDKALDLMATRAVDTTIGADFFNDPTRMHRDLLSDAARDYLPLLIDRP
jgi:hypothetical protein